MRSMQAVRCCCWNLGYLGRAPGSSHWVAISAGCSSSGRAVRWTGRTRRHTFCSRAAAGAAGSGQGSWGSKRRAGHGGKASASRSHRATVCVRPNRCKVERVDGWYIWPIKASGGRTRGRETGQRGQGLGPACRGQSVGSALSAPRELTPGIQAVAVRPGGSLPTVCHDPQQPKCIYPEVPHLEAVQEQQLFVQGTLIQVSGDAMYACQQHCMGVS